VPIPSRPGRPPGGIRLAKPKEGQRSSGVTMKTRLIKASDISSEDEARWRSLAERALEPNPYAEPDFFLVSSRHFEGYTHATLVVAEEGSEFRAVLPIAAIGKRRLPPRRVAETRSSPTAVFGVGTPLIDSSKPELSAGGLMEALGNAGKNDNWPGIVSLERLRTEGPVFGLLRTVCGERNLPFLIRDQWEYGVATRAGEWSNPVQGKRRKEIERRLRQLAKETGEEVTLVDRGQDPAAVEDFLKLEASGWKSGPGGGAFALRPDTAAWFHEWSQRWGATDRVTALTLCVGGSPVAMQYSVRAGEGIFCFRVGNDDSYARYGPGTGLFYRSLSYLHDKTDAAWFEAPTDRDNWSLHLLPERRTLSNVLIGTGGLLDRTLVSAVPALEKVVGLPAQARRRWSQLRAPTPVPTP
jgi:hypothetical protein